MKLPDSDLVFDGVEFIRRDHALGPNLIASVIRASGNDAVCGLLVNSRQGLELYPGSRIHVHRLIWRGQTLLHALRSGLGLLDKPVNVKNRKSTRLNSSHTVISYAVFCLNNRHNLYSSKATKPL